MKTCVGGGIAACFGIILLGMWWKPFLNLLAGVIPIMLLLGGGLALYLGIDEIRDGWKRGDGFEDESAPENVEEYKREIEDLKKELNSLKKA